ncbi:unnamed protein product [Rhizopus microsporus]
MLHEIVTLYTERNGTKEVHSRNEPQDKASSSYIHRKLQELPFVKKLNTSKHRSLKENTLTSINSKKTLEITSKPKNIDKKDIDAVQTFAKTVQARIQDKTFMPLTYTDLEGQVTFLYFLCTRLIPRVYRLMLNLSESLPNNVTTRSNQVKRMIMT